MTITYIILQFAGLATYVQVRFVIMHTKTAESMSESGGGQMKNNGPC